MWGLFLCAQSLVLRGQEAVDPGTRRTLRVGLEHNATFFSSLDSNGKPVGFAVDLIEAVARDRGFAVELKALPWHDVMEQFRAGKLDVLANVAYLPEREAFLDYSIPHVKLDAAVFVRKGRKPPKQLSDLKGLQIPVVRESVPHTYLRSRNVTDNFVFTHSLLEGLRLLSQGRVDAVISIKVIGQKLIRDEKLKNIEASPLALSDLSYVMHMAVQDGNAALLAQVNLGLHRTRLDGTFDALYEKWLGPIEARRLRWQDIQPYLLPATFVLLVLGFAFWRQRRLVADLQKQTEALKRSEERLTLSLEGSLDAFWDWDVTSGRVERSERWAEILGVKPEDIPPQIDALRAFLHPDDRGPFDHGGPQQIVHQGHGRAEYRLRAKDGTWRWIFDRGKVVARDHMGKALRITGAATDITARKHTEEQLARSQSLLAQSQQAAEIGGWEYDLRAGKLFWTSETFRMHDLEPTGPPPSLDEALNFYTPSSLPMLQAALERASNLGTPFELELELITAKSRLIWVRTIGRAEKRGDKVARLYGSLQDITTRKRADEERQKLQLKMLEAQKLESLGVLAGGIAHDFNNLLTVIIGNASLAREDPASTAEALSQVETAAHRAADLCRQMLAYAGKSRFSLETHDLNAIVDDTVQLLRFSISKNATLEFALSPEQLPVEADASQIRQVVMNLVINASDALASSPGRIRVSTTRQTLSRETFREARLGQDLPSGDYVLLEVNDNGSGMSGETMARIFDPFFTTKFTGRGLGLAAVLGIVRAHRGAFFVDSTLGQGSTFRMALPRTSSETLKAPGKPIARHVLTPGESNSLLVVDDELSVRKIASSILERQGYAVAMASDGYEALALALAHGAKFKAVLLDLTMPGLDGPATLRELRVLSDTLPVLLMSGYSEADARKHVANDPLVGFLPKPFTTEQLLERLQELLERAKGVG